MSDDRVADARVAPLDDEDLLEVALETIRRVVLPELQGAGADEFVLSQVRSCMSIIGFVKRGLEERQVGRATANEQLAALLAEPGVGWPDSRVRRLLRGRLALEVTTRSPAVS